MAVIPQELRSPLEVLFTVPLKSKKNVATGGHVISLQEIQFQRLLGEVRVYYEEEIDWEPLLTHAETRNFLQHLKEKGLLLGELQRVWDDLYAFLFFLNHHPEKKGLDDFAAWEFSYFVSEFLPHHFLDLTLDFAQGEHLLRSLAQLYAYLKEQGSITTDAELQKAISKILQGGKIRKIRRPAIKGPEIILATLGLKTGHEHHFTYNDYWLLILWITEFEENWKYMLSCLQAGRTKQYYITDSTRKQARAEWLKRELEESGTQPIFFFQVLQPSEQDIEKAFDWFFNKEMVL